MILSEAGREWRREAKAILESIMPGVDLPLVAPYGISISWRPADARAQDLDNRVKPILDLLQHLRVITNDSEVLDLKVQKKESQGRGAAEAAKVVEILEASHERLALLGALAPPEHRPRAADRGGYPLRHERAQA